MLPAGWQPVEGRKVVVGKVPRPRSLPHASPLTHQDRNDRVEMYYELYGTGPEKVLLIMGVLPSPCICRCRRWLTLTLGFATPCSAWHRTVAALMPQLPNHQFLIADNRGA